MSLGNTELWFSGCLLFPCWGISESLISFWAFEGGIACTVLQMHLVIDPFISQVRESLQGRMSCWIKALILIWAPPSTSWGCLLKSCQPSYPKKEEGGFDLQFPRAAKRVKWKALYLKAFGKLKMSYTGTCQFSSSWILKFCECGDRLCWLVWLRAGSWM